VANEEKVTAVGAGPRDLENQVSDEPDQLATYRPNELIQDKLARNAQKESDGAVLARLGTDARKWTDEFIAVMGRGVANGLLDANWGTIVSWFANAIEAGRSAGSPVTLCPHRPAPEAAGLVFEALGRASVCWSERPEGVFDTTLCATIGRELLTALGYEIPEGYQDR
jgi:hypothetical protein